MAKAAFRRAARDQRVCAVSGRGGRDWHSHHVLYAQHVPAGADADDPRNALRLHWSVHMRHHLAVERVPRACLTAENIEFIDEVLGERADDYLKAHYA